MRVTDFLQLNSERAYTDEGFLQVPARISRIGVQIYKASEMDVTDKDPDAPIRVFRPEEEVFSTDSLVTFTNKPVTDNHPSELVTPKNAKGLSVGHAGPEIVKDGDFAKTTLTIIDADTIAKIEAGKVELSNGYTTDIDWTPGIAPNGEAYDAVQRNIRGNHIAIVERGRAGAHCRLADNLPKDGDLKTMNITIDGVGFDVSDQAAQAVGKLQTRLNDMEETAKSEADMAKEKMADMEQEAKEAKAKSDALQAKVDEAHEKMPTDKDLDDMVEERAGMVGDALKLVPDLKWQGKSSDAIRREVVSIKCPKVQMDSESDEYINARFDIMTESASGSLDSAFKKQVTDTGDKTESRPASVIARDKFAETSRNAWKGGAN